MIVSDIIWLYFGLLISYYEETKTYIWEEAGGRVDLKWESHARGQEGRGEDSSPDRAGSGMHS